MNLRNLHLVRAAGERLEDDGGGLTLVEADGFEGFVVQLLHFVLWE